MYISIESSFKFERQPFNLPDNIGLCLVDVNSGSDTRVLVKEVLKWEKSNRPEGMENEMFSNYKF